MHRLMSCFVRKILLAMMTQHIPNAALPPSDRVCPSAPWNKKRTCPINTTGNGTLKRTWKIHQAPLSVVSGTDSPFWFGSVVEPGNNGVVSTSSSESLLLPPRLWLFLLLLPARLASRLRRLRRFFFLCTLTRSRRA